MEDNYFLNIIESYKLTNATFLQKIYHANNQIIISLKDIYNLLIYIYNAWNQFMNKNRLIQKQGNFMPKSQIQNL